MTLDQFKSNSYCVGGRHRSGTTNVKPETTTDKNGNLRYRASGTCTSCGRKKSQFFSAASIEGSGVLKDFFKGVYKKGIKPLGKKILNNPARALNVGLDLATAVGTKNPALIMNAGAQAGKFAMTGKGFTKVGNIQGKGLYLRR